MNPPPFTRAGFVAGARFMVVPSFGTFFYGIGVGILAAQVGLSLAALLGMSAVVYAGAAQMVALQTWADPVPVVAVALIAFAVNTRYILLGAALRPWFSGLSPLRAYGSLFVMGDGNWLLSIKEYESGRNDAAVLLGSGVVNYAFWFAGSWAGYAVGRQLGDPRHFAIDFLLTAFFVVNAVAIWKGKRDLAPLLVAGIAAAVSQKLLGGPWFIIIGAVAGSLTGLVRRPSHAE